MWPEGNSCICNLKWQPIHTLQTALTTARVCTSPSTLSTVSTGVLYTYTSRSPLLPPSVALAGVATTHPSHSYMGSGPSWHCLDMEGGFAGPLDTAAAPAFRGVGATAVPAMAAGEGAVGVTALGEDTLGSQIEGGRGTGLEGLMSKDDYHSSIPQPQPPPPPESSSCCVCCHSIAMLIWEAHSPGGCGSCSRRRAA